MTETPIFPKLPLAHRVARRLAAMGLRGASWYWRLARLLANEPEPGIIELSDGTPIAHDPADWTCRGSYEGTYEREVLRLLPELVAGGDVAIDVGANVGIFTARLSRLVGSGGLVVAVEPSPRCVGDLGEVVASMENVVVVEAALGVSDGTISLNGWDNPDHRGLGTVVPGHRAGLEQNWHEGQSVEVSQKRLDGIIESHLADREIGLLKVDVEGCEGAVLAGAPDLFRSGRVRAAILEVTPTVGTAWVVDLIAASNRYQSFVISETGRLIRRTLLEPITSAQAAERPEQWNLLIRRID